MILRELDLPRFFTQMLWVPCIAVAFHNSQTRNGYMLHDSSPNMSSLTDKFFETVKRENQDISRLRAFAAGGDACFEYFKLAEELKEECLKSRKFIEDTLKDLLPSVNFEVSWSPYNHIAELYLDTKTGEFTHIVTSVDDLI